MKKFYWRYDTRIFKTKKEALAAVGTKEQYSTPQKFYNAKNSIHREFTAAASSPSKEEIKKALIAAAEYALSRYWTSFDELTTLEEFAQDLFKSNEITVNQGRNGCYYIWYLDTNNNQFVLNVESHKVITSDNFIKAQFC